ncbi:hypothetical protein KSS87_013823 [Heliosperma pusillum]|nr:hypothetical protein KSS87_013823 [Heliosperma pusillum]
MEKGWLGWQGLGPVVAVGSSSGRVRGVKGGRRRWPEEVVRNVWACLRRSEEQCTVVGHQCGGFGRLRRSREGGGGWRPDVLNITSSKSLNLSNNQLLHFQDAFGKFSDISITFLHASINLNDLYKKGLCVDSDAKYIANKPGKAADDVGDEIFTMEDLPKEENQCARSTVADLEKEPSVQPPMQDLVEAGSISQSSEVDTTQCFGNGGDNVDINATVDLNEEVKIHDENQGVKRPCEESSSMESSVRVIYNSLPSRSKRKLEELLNNWSDWHAKNCASSEDPADSLESGEESYFPALHVGSDKLSTVSFSMDVHVSKRQRKESGLLSHDCSPLYDRGFAVGLATDADTSEEKGIDLREAPRCFNCGSYNHPLSGCTKSFNKAAVNSARKEFQSKKNPNGNPRVVTRYYQNSPSGKFDGIKPGALSAETRKALGLGEFDPPPWLNKMRELGYPPGYLDLEEKDQPSGIAIFGDDETQKVDVINDPPLDERKSQKKMMTEFPGINAPIPENADQSLWATPRCPTIPDFSFSLDRPEYRWNFAQDSNAIRNYPESYWLRNPINGPSPPFGFGSPPVSHLPHNYYSSEPFSPVGVPIPGSPRYRTPYLHYSYGSL